MATGRSGATLWNYPFNKWSSCSVSAARVSASFLLLARNCWNVFCCNKPGWRTAALDLKARKQRRAPVQSASPSHLSHRCRHWLEVAYLSGAKWGGGRRREGVRVISSGKRPAHTKGAAALLASHCLFLVITCGTIESVGQGEARTPARAGRASNRCSLVIIAEKEGEWRGRSLYMEAEEEEEEAAGSLTCSERGPAHMTSPAAAIVLPPPEGTSAVPPPTGRGEEMKEWSR